MDKTLVINVTEPETRVALLEDEAIVELFVERSDQSDISGNIYSGRVQKVMPGMQAAFIDIGLPQAAFMYVDDIVIDRDGYIQHPYQYVKAGLDRKVDYNRDVSSPPVSGPAYAIDELISEGQQIMVQVVKSPLGTKGARVTSYVSLPGRFMVILPISDHIGISKKIENPAERDRLKNAVLSLRIGNEGYIVRTAAEGVSEEKLAEEMTFLQKLWSTIQNKYQSISAPALLHRELAIALRAVRDLMIHEVGNIIIDDRREYELVLNFLNMVNPSMSDCVELYEGAEPVFEAFNIDGDISRALNRRVWLKSGGYIVIERAEALVAIDVNTGRYLGKRNLEETILKTNLEAVKEIAYQIRLRDIGGIIIIDFIDMVRKNNQKKVFEALQEAMLKDRSRIHVLPFTELGLVQMTRKRTRKSLTGMLCEPCQNCDGEGHIISRRTICYQIYRALLYSGHDMVGDKLLLTVSPEIEDYLHDEERQLLLSLEQKIGKQIGIVSKKEYHLEEFDIVEILGG